MSEQPVRPRQASVAGWLITGGSLFVVLDVFERVSRLRSLETREGVEDFLAEPPGEGLGLGVEDVLSLLHTLSLVAGACAAAAVILGWHALKGSRSARLALSVLAVPLFLTGLVAGGFMSALVSAAIVMLWLEPTRSWFAGRPLPEPPARRERPERPGPAAGARRDAGAPQARDAFDRVTRPAPPQPGTPQGAQPGTPPAAPSSEPGPWTGFGSAPASAEAGPSSYPPAVGAAPQPPAPAGRPTGLVWACVLTWAGAGVTAALMGLTVLVMLVAPDLVLDELRRQDPDFAGEGISDSAVRTGTLVTGGIVIVWSLVAAAFAASAFRGARWARTALLVSAATAAAACVFAAFGAPFMVVPLAACIATVVLLGRPEVRAFFRGR